MTRIRLEEAPVEVRQFLQSLDVSESGVEIEWAGRAVYEIRRPASSSRSAVDRARALIRQVRARNATSDEHTLQAEIEAAVDVVRQQP
jgi:hypothetical protein